MPSSTALLIFTILALALGAMPKQEVVSQDRDGSHEDLLDNLIRNLRPLGDSDSPLTSSALENICVDDALKGKIEHVSLQSFMTCK